MYKRAARVGAVLGLALLFTLVSAGSVFALVTRRGGAVVVGPNEVIDEDVYLFGEDITVDGKLNGSLVAAGRTVTVRGSVKGGALIAAGRILIAGDVDGGVKAAAKNFALEGVAGRDLLVMGSEVTLRKGSRVKGDLVFAGRNVQIDGVSDLDAFGGAESVYLAGTVKGNMKLWVGSLDLGTSARIGGNLSYISGEDAGMEPGSSIGGSVTRREPDYKSKVKQLFPFVLIFGLAGKVVGFFMALLVGLVLVLTFPRWLNTIADALQWETGPCAGWGALLLFGAPVGIAVAFATIVGVPLAAIALLLYAITVYISQALVGFFLGRMILKLDEQTAGKAAIFGALALGLLIIRLVRFIPIAGWFGLLAVVIFGMGAIAVAGMSGTASK